MCTTLLVSGVVSVFSAPPPCLVIVLSVLLMMHYTVTYVLVAGGNVFGNGSVVAVNVSTGQVSLLLPVNQETWAPLIPFSVRVTAESTNQRQFPPGTFSYALFHLSLAVVDLLIPPFFLVHLTLNITIHGELTCA